MKINDFIRSAFKGAVAIFIAVIALSVVGWGVWQAHDLWTKRDAKQYEVVKLWPVDLKEHLQLNLLVRTKLVGGILFAEVGIDGYPTYLSDPQLGAINQSASIFLLFRDKDGFTSHRKSIEISAFSGIVDAKGNKSGLKYQFDEYMTSETYARLSGLGV